MEPETRQREDEKITFEMLALDGPARSVLLPWLSLLAVASVAALAWYTRAVLIPALLAFGIAFALDSFVERLALKMPRWAYGRTGAVVLIFAGVTLAITLFTLFLVPQLGREFQEFAAKIPGYVTRLRDLFWERGVPVLEQRFGLEIPHTSGDLREYVAGHINEITGAIAKAPGSLFSAAAERTAAAVGGLFGFFFVPFYLFFFLRDFPEILRAAERVIPRRHAPDMYKLYKRIDDTLAAFFRGQIIVAAILAVFYTVGLRIIGIELALLLGVLSGILFFLPYLGVIAAATLATLVALMNFESWLHIAAVPLLYVFGSTVEGIVLTPNIVGERLGLKPWQAVLAILFFGKIGGILGVFVALPTAASLRIFWLYAVERYLRSDYYQSPPKRMTLQSMPAIILPAGATPGAPVPPVRPSGETQPKVAQPAPAAHEHPPIGEGGITGGGK